MYNNPAMYPNNVNQIQNYPGMVNPNQDDRVVGGFLGPFILGGITGGLVAPFFTGGYGNSGGYNNNYNQPPYYTNNYYYPPYYYGPYYY